MKAFTNLRVLVVQLGGDRFVDETDKFVAFLKPRSTPLEKLCLCFTAPCILEMIDKGLPKFNANEIILEARYCNFVLRGDKYFHTEEERNHKKD